MNRRRFMSLCAAAPAAGMAFMLLPEADPPFAAAMKKIMTPERLREVVLRNVELVRMTHLNDPVIFSKWTPKT